MAQFLKKGDPVRVNADLAKELFAGDTGVIDSIDPRQAWPVVVDVLHADGRRDYMAYKLHELSLIEKRFDAPPYDDAAVRHLKDVVTRPGCTDDDVPSVDDDRSHLDEHHPEFALRRQPQDEHDPSDLSSEEKEEGR